ncbi:ATP-binding cassette domain-containing protein [Kocuria massiliensis]|uniref:ABC transporter ATP-binding protein/permease n=1 Tax=Kocuria massiliensis TaxID=1926282 RepID=UPI0022B9865D|nr:ATP-binding cassette domain-containing protein [Kocuria massiliensis]
MRLFRRRRQYLPEPPESSDPLIRLTGVSRIFEGADSPVLDEVDLSISAGEFVAIVGPSGAGKSTLLNILALLDRPSRGTYLLSGRDVSTCGASVRNALRARMFGLIFQSSNMLMDESSLTNAMMGLRVRHVPRRARRDRAAETLRGLGLGHRLGTRTKLLSGGERQRCAIARAVATDPPVVLADEPTGNLDEENTARVMEILRDLHARGKTVVVITHDPEVAASAERRILLRGGRIAEDTGRVGVRGLTRPRPSPRQAADGASASVATGTDLPRGAAGTGLRDDLAEAFGALLARPLRAVVVVLSFMLGVGGLTSSIGLSETAGHQVQSRIVHGESTQLTASYRDARQLLERERTGSLTPADQAERTLGSLRYVKSVGYLAQAAPSDVRVSRFSPWDPEGEAQSTSVATLSLARARQAKVRFYPDAAANVLRQMDAGEAQHEAILSRSAAQSLGMYSGDFQQQPHGYHVWVDGRRLDVVGMYDPGDGLPLMRNSILVAPEVTHQLQAAVVEFTVDVEPGFARAVHTAIPLALDPANPCGISVTVASDLGALRRGVAGDLGLFVAVLSGVLLVLAGLSTGTSMYLSVQSRSSEIALRRAIGATRGSIARIFMTEGLLMGLVGGAWGALGGMTATVVIATSQEWEAILHPWLPVVGLVVGSVVGLASSAYPSWVASRQDPAGAMRA